MRTQNLQDVFLNYVRKEKIVVQIYLTNGFQLRGIVRGFDSFTVILDGDGKQNLIYKHAISTVIPCRFVNVASLFNYNRNNEVSETNSQEPAQEATVEAE
jgi:host factor-I protein